MIQCHSTTRTPVAFANLGLISKLGTSYSSRPRRISLYGGYRHESFHAEMCHRQLLFQQSAGCGHLTKVGEINVDCRYPKCFISSIHPRFCRQNAPCSCRRYYSNPVRKITAIVPGRCSGCMEC
ncbi:hypothetical protein EDD18DRAFT_491758 [Armillaria luteobubalina]|uniref:Uncharacterized protein n=1 Tax=Armillaria luteobubalina TaxID=153913 RepID=A0AA39QJS3_9AGAR|nr:hypothetical protein EDD18DRAFT_491758 [Armillaria luteobubalina]